MKIISSLAIKLLVLLAPLNAIASNAISIDSLGLGTVETSQQNILKHFNGYSPNSENLDQNGWSILTPSVDSRLIYVNSSSGNDQTGEIYNISKISNINQPGKILEFKTIQAALKHIRPGYPDYLLLKRGGSWLLEKTIKLKGGRSSSERMVLMAYGEPGARPKINSSDTGIRVFGTRSFIAISGLHLYAHNRDPNSASFSGWGSVPNSIGIKVSKSNAPAAKSILIENCVINFYNAGITISGNANYQDIVVRRNIITNSYSENTHSSGFHSKNASILMEENLFDHNGWFKQREILLPGKRYGQATKFNHNTYFANSNNSIIRNNIFLRSSSIHNKWASNSKADEDTINTKNILVRNNFYYGGEIGISAGGNKDRDTGPRWSNMSFIDNVMSGIGKNQPTNRTLGWYIAIDDWETGIVCGNYLLNTQNKNVTNLSGVSVTGHSSDIIISHNTISGLVTDRSKKAAISLSRGPVKNITIAFNAIHLQNSHMQILAMEENRNNQFSNNRYFTEASKNKWFKFGRNNLGFSDWKEITLEKNSRVDIVNSVDANRNFESYLSSVGFSSINEFIGSVTGKSKHNWSSDYSAKSINEFLRQGHGNQRCPGLKKTS